MKRRLEKRVDAGKECYVKRKKWVIRKDRINLLDSPHLLLTSLIMLFIFDWNKIRNS